MSTKLTPWFPGDMKPKRKGAYERKYPIGKPQFSYWNGRVWRAGVWSADKASNATFVSDHQKLPWRGLITKEA